MATTLPVVDADPPAGEAAGGRDRRAAAVRAGVLAALGRPGWPYRVVVVPLWEDRYRVNVLTGGDPTAVRIPFSYFVVADGLGNILETTPVIREIP